jgi:hypothetical protein
MIKLLLAMLIVVGCGGTKAVPKPNLVHQELFNLTENIERQLYWCEGVPTGSRKNNITLQPHCDNGDASYFFGLTILLGNIGDVNNYANFFNANGQPFRAPSYVDKSTENSFSRDQLTGMLAAATKTKNITYLLKLKNYVDRTGKLCPDAVDNRCDITPNMHVLMSDTLGIPVTKVERWATDDGMVAEAHTIPGNYRSMLLAYQLFVKIEQGKVSQANKNAAIILEDRFPKNLMFRVLNATMNKKSFDTIITDMIACMKVFKEPGENPFFSRGDAVCGIPGETYLYWDLIALSHYIQPLI